MSDSGIDKLLAERQRSHGDFGAVAAVAQTIKQSLRRAARWDALPEKQREALEMITVKMARIVAGDHKHRDHWNDIAGYARLVTQDLHEWQ